MKLAAPHRWDLTPAQARALQQELRTRAETIDRFEQIRHVAGVDVGFARHGHITRAAVAVLTFPGLGLEHTRTATTPTTFPYVPGLLSFREIPAILDVLRQLPRLPDLLICDGHGRAHPRRFGLACHVGVVVDRPTIGVAKTLLIGKHGPVPSEKGNWTPLEHKDEVIGAVLRTRGGVKPVYVSCGHRVSLETAIELVMACVTRYRLPETTRHADRLASNRQPK